MSRTLQPPAIVAEEFILQYYASALSIPSLIVVQASLAEGSELPILEEILAERQPLHDRLQGLHLRPLDFWRARSILGEGDPERQLVAYGLAGGMPKYLAELAGTDDPLARIAELALSPLGRLFDEARTVLAQELDAPATHFSLLAALAEGPAAYATIERRSRGSTRAGGPTG